LIRSDRKKEAAVMALLDHPIKRSRNRSRREEKGTFILPSKELGEGREILVRFLLVW